MMSLMIKQIIIDEIDSTLPETECAVLLSGGVDSLSVAFAAAELGKKITGYSFTKPTFQTYDYRRAEGVCKVMNWDFVGVQFPTDNLVEDFHRLLRLGCETKTHFECCFPFLYLYPKIKEKYVLSGWAADGYYGLSKKAQINYKHPKEKFDKFRRDYFQPHKRAGYNWHKKIADKHNKIFLTPYLCQGVSDFFFSYDWEQLNKPKQKHHIRSAFSQYFSAVESEIGTIRQHLNLQLDASVPLFFSRLLDDSSINFNRRKTMDWVYKDWVKKYNSGSLDNFL